MYVYICIHGSLSDAVMGSVLRYEKTLDARGLDLSADIIRFALRTSSGMKYLTVGPNVKHKPCYRREIGFPKPRMNC